MSNPASLAFDAERFATERVAALRSPASVLAVSGADLARVAGVGDRGDGLPPDCETVFRIASVTKSFTAVRILQLRDAGLLDLDAPVSAYLPSARMTPAHWAAELRLRHLLAMSGGLPTDDAWADRLEALPAAEFDALLESGIRLVRAPGTGYEYANLGWAMLGRIAERIDGRPLPAQVEAEVLVPLGLTGVRFTPPAGRPLAVGHARRRGTWIPQPLTGPGAFSAIGGLFASAADLLRWAAWLAAAFSGGGAAVPSDAEDHVLSAASRREMQRVQCAFSPTAGYGYGLIVEETPEHGRVISHSGGYPGFSAHLRWSPTTGLAMCGLENAGYSGLYDTVPGAFARLQERAQPIVELGDPQPFIPVPSTELASPWPETRAAVTTVQQLFDRPAELSGWSAAERTSFAACVAQDLPLAERSDEFARARVALGPDATPDPAGPWFPTAARALWRMIGRQQECELGVDLSPTEPPRIQRITLRVYRRSDREDAHAPQP